MGGPGLAIPPAVSEFPPVIHSLASRGQPCATLHYQVAALASSARADRISAQLTQEAAPVPAG